MRWARHPRTRMLLVLVAIVAVVAVLATRLGRVARDKRGSVIILSKAPMPAPGANSNSQPTPLPNGSENSASATGVSSPFTFSPSPGINPTPALPLSSTSPGNLIIPVAGVRADQLLDTFADARSEGRVHDAIDIAAPRGTPVLAATDGPILKLFHSDRGGTTIYQLSTDSKFVYYYAHLDRYVDGLAVGHLAKQGETIAYVGDTGNAGAGNYHLHFSIAVVSDPKRYWEGVNINPYPFLKR